MYVGFIDANVYPGGTEVQYDDFHDEWHVLSSSDLGFITWVIPVVNEPPVINKKEISLYGNATVTINNTHLDVTDPDGDELTFTVTGLPARGELRFNESPMNVGATFTPQHLAEGRITYAHDDSDFTSDSFTFSVSDGELTENGTFTFNITPRVSTTLSLHNRTTTYGSELSFGVDISTPREGIVTISVEDLGVVTTGAVSELGALVDPWEVNAPVGTWVVTAEFTPFDLNTHRPATATATLTVNPALVTVTANERSKVYGDADPALTYAITSGELFFGEDFTGELSRGDGESVGTYDIERGTLDAGSNYTLTFVPAEFEITPRPIIVKADPQTKVYGDTDPALTYDLVGSLAFTDEFTGSLTRDAGEDADTYTIRQGTLALTSNYDLTFEDADLTITARPITVAADAQSKAYGDPEPALTYEVTSGSLVSPGHLTGSLTREAGDTPGTYAIQQGDLDATSNYAMTFQGANLTITPRPITVTVDTQTKVYGDDDPELTYQITEGSLLPGHELTGGLSRLAGDNVGSYAIQQGDLDVNDPHYAVNFVGANLTITQRPITVTAEAKSKVYGEDDPALTYDLTAGSLVEGDTFTGNLSRVAGEDVGNHAIQRGTLTAGGNYDLNFEGANLTITQRPITVTADAQSKVYGDPDPALTYDLTEGSLVDGDAFSGNPNRVAGEDVGTHAIQQGTLTAGGNYNLTFESADLTITKRPITVRADAQSKVYGDDDPLLTHRIMEGSLAFTDIFSGSLGREAGENVGTTRAINQGTLSLGDNYTLTFEGADLTITVRPITVTADAKTKVYGEADPDLTYEITDGSLAFDDDFRGSLNRVAGEDADTYAIEQGTLELTSNYDLRFEGALLTITKRRITVTAEPQTKVYGEADPGLTYEITFGSLAFTDALNGNLSRVAGEAVGAYAIERGSLTASDNYDLTYEGADLIIGKRAITVTADAQTKIYGEADPDLSYTVTLGSLAFTDTVTGGLSRISGETVGTYAIEQGTLAANSNYDLSFVSADLTIAARPVTVTVDAKSKVYGEVDPDLTYQITEGSLLDGDGFTGSLIRVAGEAAGAYEIQQGDLAVNNANYALIFESADLTIAKRLLTVTTVDSAKVYGEANPAFTVIYSEFAGGDSEALLDGSLSYQTDAVQSSPAGTYEVTPTGLTSPNYEISFVAGTLTIAPAPLTITADDKTKTYGALNPAFTVTFDGFVLGEDATVLGGSLVFSTEALGSSPTGDYEVMPSGLTSPNYDITFEGGTLTVAPAPLTVRADNKSRYYNYPNPTFTATFSGFVLGEAKSHLAGELIFTTEAVRNSAPGTYAITPSGVSSVNYDITFIDGTLTIRREPYDPGPPVTPPGPPVTPPGPPVTPPGPPVTPPGQAGCRNVGVEGNPSGNPNARIRCDASPETIQEATSGLVSAPAAQTALAEATGDTVQEAIQQAQAEFGQAPRVVLRPGSDTTVQGAVISQEGLALLSSVGGEIAIETRQGTLILPTAVLEKLNEGLDGSLVILFEDFIDEGVEAVELPHQQAKDMKPASPIVEVTVATRYANGDVHRHHNFSVSLTLTLPIIDMEADEELAGVYRFELDDDGNIIAMQYVGGEAGDGSISVARDSLSFYGVVVYDREYDDVPETHWAHRSIKVMTARHVVQGVSETHFDPERAVTRAEFAAMVARAFWVPMATTTQSFADVGADKWYAQIMSTVVQAGLFTPEAGNILRPDVPITRQEMVVVIARAMERFYPTATLPNPDVNTTLAPFKDQGEVDAGARDEMARLVAAGLVNGRSVDELAPGGTTKRAEAVTLIKRLLDWGKANRK